MNEFARLAWEGWVTLALGVGVAVVVAAVSSRLARRGAWQRAVWLTALCAGLALLIAEVTGVDRQVARLAQQQLGIVATAPPTSAEDADRVPSPLLNDISYNSTAERSVTPAVDDDTANLVANDVAASFAAPAIALPTESPPFSRSLFAVLRQSFDDFAWLLPTVWFGVALALLFRLLIAQRAVAAVTRSCPLCVESGLYQRVRQVAAQLGLRRIPTVRMANQLAGPLVCGLARPTLVLPARFTEDYTLDEQMAMLAHEMGHVAQRDPQWQFVADVFCGVLWWHPAAYWLRTGFRTACETAADETSLMLAAGPETLAACLIRVGRRLTQRRQPALVGMLGGGYRSGLGRRVQRLLQLHGDTWARPARIRLVIVGMLSVTLCVGSATLGTLWARPALHPTGDSTMTAFVGSWRTSLAGVALVSLMNVAVAEDGPPKDGPKPPAARREDGPPGEGPIRERIREARERIAKLREEGKTDEANALEQKIREAMQRVQGEGGPRPFQQLPPEAQAKMREIREALMKAREAGKEDEVRALEEKMRAMMQEIQKNNPPRAGGDRPNSPPIPPELQAKMREIREALQQAREAGKADEVRELEQKARTLMQEFQKNNPPREGDRPNPEGRRPDGGDRPNPEGRRPEGGPREGEGPRGQPDRIRLIMEAAERLRQAGLAREADELIRRAREQGPQEGPRRDGEGRSDAGPRREGEGRPEAGPRREGDQPRRDGEGPRREGDQPRRDGEGPRGEGRPNAGGNEDMLRIIRELRNEVEQLRRELNEVRNRRGEKAPN